MANALADVVMTWRQFSKQTGRTILVEGWWFSNGMEKLFITSGDTAF
jgi:hypothetical protein